MRFVGVYLLLALLGAFAWQGARADISFAGENRYIFAADAKRRPITIVNDGAQPALVQVSVAWGGAISSGTCQSR